MNSEAGSWQQGDHWAYGAAVTAFLGAQEAAQKIPWKKLLSKAPVWALIVSHFCHNWGTFILLTWMPTYYSQVGLPPLSHLSLVR